MIKKEGFFTMTRAWIKWVVAAIIVAAIAIYGFSFILYEGNVVLITRFGAPRVVIEEAGIHFKLPWPFERVYTFDKRQQQLDSSFIEALTKDKKNVIMQTYTIWRIKDPLKYLQSTTGDQKRAENALDGLVTNAKNEVLGRYNLSGLVSTVPGELKIEEIQNDVFNRVKGEAERLYGIEVSQIGVRRMGLPESNIASAFDQMRAERNKYVEQLKAEGERDANIIRNEADVKVAKLIAEGKEESARIMGEVELEVAKIYADAQKKNPEFFTFLRSLDSLSKILGSNSTLIFKTDTAPFNALDGMGGTK